MPRILTVTVNPAVDLWTSTARIQRGRKIRCDPPRRDPGGGGINVARAIIQLGGSARALYPRGGSTGEMLDAMLARLEVPTLPIDIAGVTRESFTVTEHAGHCEFRFVMPGPELAASEWRAVLQAVREADPAPDYVVASGSLAPGVPEDLYAQVAQVAADRGARMVLDTSSGAALRAALEQGVYLIKPNRDELADIVGRQAGDLEEVAAQAHELAGGGAEVVVVSLGGDGAVVCDPQESLHAIPPEVQRKSDVGAGDSFVGGMTLALARGETVEEALRQGTAAGAAALCTPGTELCRREDAERLRDRVEIRRL
jgi:6-phosphofructokinase 2